MEEGGGRQNDSLSASTRCRLSQCLLPSNQTEFYLFWKTTDGSEQLRGLIWKRILSKEQVS